MLAAIFLLCSDSCPGFQTHSQQALVHIYTRQTFPTMATASKAIDTPPREASPYAYISAPKFDSDDADFILQSAKHAIGTLTAETAVTEFRVHKAKLAKSPVFADLLAIGEANEKPGETPLLKMGEHPAELYILLLLIYDDIEDLPDKFVRLVAGRAAELYEACFKYDLPLAQLAVEMMIQYALLR